MQTAPGDELAASEVLARIVSALPVVIFSYHRKPDGTACFPYSSASIANIFGIPSPVLAADAGPALALIHPEDEGRVRQSVDDSMDTLSEWHCEWRVNRKDGTMIWVEGWSTPVRNPDGSTTWYGNLANVTERKRTEELLQCVLDNTIDGIIGINAHGTISMMNKAGERIFGYELKEVIGQNVHMLMPEPYHSEHDTYITNYLRTGVPKLIGIGREVKGQRKNGQRFPLALAVTEFSLYEQRYFMGIVRDITERRLLETQLRQAQKMEAFGQLAGGIAHDFNNLLTVIFGNVHLLENAIGTEDSDKLELLQEVYNAGQRAATLTHQLLAFSRQQVLEPRLVDLNTVVTEIQKLLRRLIGEDVELTITLAALLSRVKVDPGQVDQVIVNLAVNARDAMPRGGKLTIETSEVTLDESYTTTHPDVPAGRYVLLALTDTGMGMTPEVQERAFEPFFTTKEIGRGSGLGLSVVHGIVRQSGGSISLYSEVGHGTCVKIYFPAVANPALQFTPAVSVPPPGNETVLLVEDEDGVRRLADRVLRRSGYTLHTAENGEQAMRLVRQLSLKVDILVTDVVMPEMSGRALAEALRAEQPDVKVLYMSGYTTDAIVRHGVLESSAHFMQKPFTPESLAIKVREVLDAKAPKTS